MNIFVKVSALTDPYPQVIKVGDTCYELVGGVQQAADTPTIDGEFEDCDDCAADVSYSSSSSQGLSSSSSQGLSSSSSSLGLSSSSSSQGISSSSSQSAENSSSSSQSAVLPLGCATDPCAADTCGGSNDPNIIMRIFDADYVGGSINWAGQTWTQQNVIDGVCKCTCPTTYTAPFTTQYTTPYYYVNHQWINNNAPALTLVRYNRNTSFFPAAGRRNLINGRGTAVQNQKLWQSTNFNFASPDLAVATPAGFTPIDNVPIANLTTYKITDDFFDWTQTIAGIDYSIARGINWP